MKYIVLDRCFTGRVMTNDDKQISATFEQNGFAVVENLADQDTVRELGAIYDGMLSGDIPCPGTDRQLGGLTRQIMQPHLHHPFFANNPALDRAKDLSRLLVQSDEPQFLFSMLIHKPPSHPHDTPWHQDMSYARKPFTAAGTHWPGHVIAQFWLALDDVDESMGCMEFLPGAHRQPMPEHFVAGGAPDDDGRLLGIVNPESRLDLSQAVKCPLNAGSATVHGYATPHYTGPNRSTHRGRRAYIFSFANMEALGALSQQKAA
jgi:ectoine hydroxylase-related dioxygenase (phytanoyl-CoA dioxygenase family)